MILVAVVGLVCYRTSAQIYDTNSDYVQTFAGSGFSGYLDGVGQLTMFDSPSGIVADSHGNLFVWDSNNYRIREISPNGTVTTFAGGGSGNNYQGTGTNVTFPYYITALAIDPNNTLWASSTYESWLWRITSDAVVTYTNFSGLGIDPPSIPGVCADCAGNIYFSSGNQIYRYATNGTLSVFAGSGNSGYADGNGIFTSFKAPEALAADAAGNIYVWDYGNGRIRRIDQSQNVTTIAGNDILDYESDGVGTNAGFTFISQMCVDVSGNLYLACDSCIRKMNAQSNVVTMAGSFTQYGYMNGAGNVALFNEASGVCISSGTIYVGDSGNERIRDITFNPQPQVVTGANLGIGTFAGVTITGAIGRTYEIQSSPDMHTWTTVATILLTSSPYLWIDQNPIAGNKFYQAVLLP